MTSKSLRDLNKLAGRYIPQNAAMVAAPDNVPAVAYIYTADRNGAQKVFAIGYGGKRTKSDWHYSFKDETVAREHIAKWFIDRAEVAKVKAGWKAQREAGKCLTPRDVWNKVRGGNDYISCAETAVCLRATLAREFPSVKFSVTSENYSMGSSIHVSWTDGPDCGKVDATASRFSFKGFDGMIDMSYSKDRWLSRDGSMTLAQSEGTTGSRGSASEIIGDPHAPDAVLVRHGAGYVKCRRSISPAVKLELTRKVCARYNVELPGEFSDETALERFLNTTRVEGHGAEFSCGWNDLQNLVYRASTGAITV